MWSVRSALRPGMEISLSDLEARRITMPEGYTAYVSTRTDVTHFVVLRAMNVGELLPASAISRNAQVLQMSAVPISVHGSDLPVNLQAGETINLYHVGDSRLSKEIGPPSIVLSHAFILGIDRKGQNMGGDLGLTVSVNMKNVLQVLDATASGRVVVVRVNG